MTQEVKVLIWISVLTLLILSGAVYFLGKSSLNAASENNTGDIKLLVKSDSHKIATESAKITIVEFGDYQCPACGMAYPVVKQVLKDYPGKINFVFRNFPLPQHNNGFIAAEAVEASGEQGKYWEMHDKLYQNQNEWAENNNPLEVFLKYAGELNLDEAGFKSSILSNKYQQIITNDKNDGISLGVDSTPTFYYFLSSELSKDSGRGIKMDSFSYSEFKKVVDSAYN